MTDSIDEMSPKDWDRVFQSYVDAAKRERFGEYSGPDTDKVDRVFKPIPRKPWAEAVQEARKFNNTEQDSVVNKPSHYQGKYECIDVIEDRLSIEAFQGYLEGNVWKYLYRYRNKNGVTDLKKAYWYLDRLIRSAM